MKNSIILWCLQASSPMALAADYCNARFDYCVDVPDQLTWQPESINGDGRHSELANSDAEVLVYGSHEPTILGNTDSQYLNVKQQDYHANTQVTYELPQAGSYTVSGYDEDGQIFYHVIKVKDGTAAQLHLNYPKSDKNKMTAIVKQMARSFTLY